MFSCFPPSPSFPPHQTTYHLVALVIALDLQHLLLPRPASALVDALGADQLIADAAAATEVETALTDRHENLPLTVVAGEDIALVLLAIRLKGHRVVLGCSHISAPLGRQTAISAGLSHAKPRYSHI